MTHQDECPAINDLTALLIEHGPDAFSTALATFLNHAMHIEREHVLKAQGNRILLTLEKKIHGRWAGWPIPHACHTAENEKTRKRAG